MIIKGLARHILLIVSYLFIFQFLASCGTPIPLGNDSSTTYYQISGGLKAGPFKIERVQLDFAQGLSSITVNKGQKISPVTTIKYQGTGVLSANWLVDDLVVERVNISLSHGSLLTLSPKPSTRIPTFILGRHSIRLQINRPKVDFREPKLSYFVINH